MVLNIKGALHLELQPDGSPECVRESVENCPRILGGRGKIDVFECARRDHKVRLKETLGALAELVNEGKIGGVALSEVSADTIRCWPVRSSFPRISDQGMFEGSCPESSLRITRPT